MADPSFWSIALPTVVGAVVGGGISALVASWTFHKESEDRVKIRDAESRERYEERLTDRLFKINEDMLTIIPGSARSRSNLLSEVWTISNALKNISISADDTDRALILLFSNACSMNKAHDIIEVNNLFKFLIDEIIEWRNQTEPLGGYLEQVKAKIEKVWPSPKEVKSSKE